MDPLTGILLAVLIDSAAGLLGVLSLFIQEGSLEKFLGSLVAFSAGTMVGGSFLHLIPEAFEITPLAGELVALGFLGFFVIEKIIHWRHCHKVGCEEHPFTWLTIIGDSIHNIIDGLVIASAFLVDPAIGAVTSLAIIAHEVPQEVGNFAVLVHGGFSKRRAILWTFISQATCILGGLLGYFLRGSFESFLLPFAAGGFIYIATVDLLPEIKDTSPWKSFATFSVGVITMYAIKVAFHV